MGDILFPKESYAITGAAMEVFNVLGRGFLEGVYHEALAVEFLERNIPFESQKILAITYKGRVLEKKYVADFYVYGKIVVELKAQKCLTEIDLAQTINYLKATNCQLGIVINFGNEEKLEIKRLARSQKT